MINGKSIELTHSFSLIQAVEQFGAQPPFALAVNGQFIPKSQHLQYELREGDAIDILSPVQGG